MPASVAHHPQPGAPASGRRPSLATAGPQSCGQPAPPSPARRGCLWAGKGGIVSVGWKRQACTALFCYNACHACRCDRPTRKQAPNAQRLARLSPAGCNPTLRTPPCCRLTLGPCQAERPILAVLGLLAPKLGGHHRTHCLLVLHRHEAVGSRTVGGDFSVSRRRSARFVVRCGWGWHVLLTTRACFAHSAARETKRRPRLFYQAV